MIYFKESLEDREKSVASWSSPICSDSSANYLVEDFMEITHAPRGKVLFRG